MVVTPIPAQAPDPAMAPFRLAIELDAGPLRAWQVATLRHLAAEPGLAVTVARLAATDPAGTRDRPGARAPTWHPVPGLRAGCTAALATLDLPSAAPGPGAAGTPPPDLTLVLTGAGPGRTAAAATAGRRWVVTDGAGRALAPDAPLLTAITAGEGIALQLLAAPSAPSGAGTAPWTRLRTLHRTADADYRRGLDELPPALVELVRQALVDVRLGLPPRRAAAPPQAPAARPSGGLLRALAAGTARAWRHRQRARWLSEFWTIGVVDAPIQDWVTSGGRLPVHWLTNPSTRGYWADPMGLPGDPQRLYSEYVDERTGCGHIEILTLCGHGAQEHLHQRQRLGLGRGSHVSFPLVVEIDGLRLGLLESCARRDCVLHRIDEQGRWQPWVTMLHDVALADPALFVWEGRYWLAGTDIAHGAHDALNLYYAERLEGPWLAHANNPVKIDIRGARMAGGCFTMPGPAGPVLIRPAQDCLGGYGSALALQRIVRCTPTEYEEEPWARIGPRPDWPAPHGLHTASAWGERTLIDAKRHGVNPRVVWRKLRQRAAPLTVGQAARAPLPAHADGPPAGHRVCVYIPHLRLGGGETSLLRLIGGFLRDGLAVDLVVHTLATAELTPPPGARVIELGVDGTLGALRRLVAVLRERRPTWLLSGFPHTNVAAVAAVAWAGVDCRCIVSEHAPLSRQIRQQANWRYRVLPPLVRWAYRRADAVVAVSTGVRDDLVRIVGAGLQPHVIANPVLEDVDPDPEALAPATPLHPWLGDPALEVVLSVSRLSEEKGLPMLLQAFAALHAQRPATRLLLVGEGPQRAALEALVAARGLAAAVQLPGRVHQPMRWMRQARVFALASQYEGFGNVLIEALASGTPVVSTDCPVGPREILADGRYGALVPVGDAPAMARALAQALEERHPPAGATGHARGYTVGRASAAYRRVFDTLVPSASC